MITVEPRTTDQDKPGMTRVSGAYLWSAPFLAIPVGRLRDPAGTEALIAGYAVSVALTAAAIWKAGAAKSGS